MYRAEGADKRLDYIDGLRGIASLMVFTCHFLISFYPVFLSEWPGDPYFQRHPIVNCLVFSPLSIFYSGGFAIMVFFVLSGYVLSYRWCITGLRSMIFSAAAGRYFRLTIPVFFSTLVAYGCLRFDLFFNQQTALLTHSEWLARFYRFDADFFPAVRFSLYDVYFHFDSIRNYNPPLWIMQAMLVGSGVVFFIQLLLSSFKKRFLLYPAALLLLCKTFYAAFVLGMVLCDWSMANHHTLTLLRRRSVLFLLCLLGIYLGSYKPHGYWMYAILDHDLAKLYLQSSRGIVYHLAGAFLIVYVFLHSRIIQWCFSQPPLVFFGRISYSLYVLHFIVLCSLSCFFFNRLYESTLPKTWCVLITLAITFSVTTLVSYLFYLTVERVSIRFSRELYGRLVSACRAISAT